jgi:MoaA/NifB/PqqE/SkfB family radical SAM enzyme
MTEPLRSTGAKAVLHPISRFRQRYREVTLMSPPLKGIRAYANWIRGNYEILRGTSRIRARPWKLTFDPTNVCQLRCPLCPTGLQVQDREIGHAQLHMFEHLLDEVGDYVFFLDFFNWGEPLLNTRLEDFVQLASSKNIVCNLSTNLSLPLTDERIHRLVTCGLNEILVSLDGASSGTYTTYRRNGKFEMVLENMRRIIQAKRGLGQTFPLVTWQFLVFRFNEHETDKAKAMAEEIGVDRLIFRAPFLDVDRYPLPESDRKEVAAWAPSEPQFRILEPGPKTRCGWQYMSSAINWDGSVASCCTTFKKQDDFGTIGKTGEHSYMEVVNNEAYRSARDRFAGRITEPVALICEQCPTPSIMDYHKYINRQVILFSLVAAVRAVRRFFRGSQATHRDVPSVPALPAGRFSTSAK